MLRVDRHRLGPRVYLFGVRVHEFQLGLALFAALAIGAALGAVEPGLPAALAAFAGCRLIAKELLLGRLSG
jgi:hypothetical protein